MSGQFRTLAMFCIVYMYTAERRDVLYTRSEGMYNKYILT